MPPRGRKNPALLGPDGDAGPQIELVETDDEIGQGDAIAEAEEAGQDEPGVESAGPDLLYDGELLQTSMTLAVVLPGDVKESYFGARAVVRNQPWETAEDTAGRAVTVVREACIGQLDDAVDALQEYMKQLIASGRVPTN